MNNPNDQLSEHPDGAGTRVVSTEAENSRTRPKRFPWLEVSIVVLVIFLLAYYSLPTYQDYSARSRVLEVPKAGAQLLSGSDSALSRLAQQELALSVPERMELGDVHVVELALGGSRSFQELSSILETNGKLYGATVQVSPSMEAQLSGSQHFEILAATPTIQVVSAFQPTVWRWQVKPKDLGTYRLDVSLNALISVDGEKDRFSVRRYSQRVDVEVTSLGGVWAGIERYWTYLVFGFGLIGVAVKYWLGSKSSSDSNASDKSRFSLKRRDRKRSTR